MCEEIWVTSFPINVKTPEILGPQIIFYELLNHGSHSVWIELNN